MTSKGEQVGQGALGVCVCLWAFSYLSPVYFLPITLFANFWFAMLVWGIALSGTGHVACRTDARSLALRAVPLLGLGVLAACAATQADLVATLMLLAAAAVFLFGSTAQDARWTTALRLGLLIAGLLSAVVAIVQVAFPFLDLPGVGPNAFPGRAGGNVRQPNLLAQLLVQALIAGMALTATTTHKLPRPASWALAFLLGVAVSFTQSRTGWLLVGLLAGWALLDKRMARELRLLPVPAVVGCLLGVGLALALSHANGISTYMQVRATSPDLSSSRFGIWANAWQMLRDHGWAGVGWGQFAQAWALTPFPDRPRASFDNAHNLPLHLAVELGVPLTLGLLAGLLWVAFQLRFTVRGTADRSTDARLLVAALAALALHCLLEYPLWFNFFLLPAAFFLGRLVYLRTETGTGGARDAAAPDTSASRGIGIVLKVAGVAIVAGSFFAAWDYARVLQVFTPFGKGLRQSLEQRIEEGRKSVLFGYWVDFGVVTNADDFTELGREVEHARHHRMNPHMLLIYARHLHERGEDDKAAYVAARLKEFNNPVAREFFAACDQLGPGEPPPFQCRPPEKQYGWDDFR